MNINKFTQKSVEAVNQCEKIAYDCQNQEIDQEHLLYSMLTIEDSLILSLLEPGTAAAPEETEGFRRTGLHEPGAESGTAGRGR